MSELRASQRHDAARSVAGLARHPRLPDVIERLGWCAPAFMAGAPFVAGLIGWVELGRPPRPWVDDPKSMSLAVRVAVDAAVWLVMAVPAVMFGSVLAVVWRDFAEARFSRRTVIRLGLPLAAWLAAIASMLWDPLRIWDWIMD